VSDGHRGVLVYSAITIAGAAVVDALLSAMHLSVGDPGATGFILAAMWIPACARWVATRTVDRAWRPPFPLRRWGRPRSAVVLVPLGIVCAIYGAAYALAWAFGVPTERPMWHGARLLLNLAVNVPLLAIVDGAGSLGEELGWRGYLQPRLDQLGVRGSLLWVIAIETLFHVPVILLAGYLAGGTWVQTIVLFIGLGMGLTPVWTWATYRWRTIWMAVAFHTCHNAVSQVLLPKALGEGGPLVLGESGVLPVAFYLLAAGLLVGIAFARGRSWRDFAFNALSEAEPLEAS
jgi:membrane protease YdiL (CAAX protease family)